MTGGFLEVLEPTELACGDTPKPTVKIRSDASTWAGSTVCDTGLSFQHKWPDKKQEFHINLLELRAASLCLHELTSPDAIVRLYLDNILTLRGTPRSTVLYAESFKL